MQKILIIGFSLCLLGCESTQNRLESKIESGVGNLNLIEIVKTDWNNLRILKPYQSKKIFGEDFSNQNDGACLWVFSDNTKVVESFSIPREKADCLELPEKTFSRTESIFILKDQKLQLRKKFEKK